MRWFLLLVLCLTACGSNSALTELGAGTGDISGTPSTTPSKKLVAKTINAGSDHTCAVLTGGTVECWGFNNDGQLGNGSTATSLVPVTVDGITDATAVAVGGEQTCVLRNIGTVQCWGEGTTDNGGENSYVPVTVSGITNAIAIAVGDADCALLSGGTVQCWGDNSIGELGNNDLPMDSAVPVTVSGITNAVAVAAGGADNCALLNDGTVQCWGQNNDGQVGNGTRTGDSVGVEGDIAVPVPVSVIGLTNAVSVAVDGEDACALLSDGTVQCWGGNDHGELGNGTATNLPIPSIERTPPATNVSTVPVTVLGITNATAIIAGGCALLNDGTVQCWGPNGGGQLGNGTTVNNSMPVTVLGITNAVAVSGPGSTCTLLSDGTVQCWGGNSYGELGNGTTTNSSVPVTVSGF